NKFPKILTFCLLVLLAIFSPPASHPAMAGLFDWNSLEQMLALPPDAKSASQTGSGDPAVAPGSLTVMQELVLAPGDTLMKVLLAAGVSREQASRAIEAAQDFIDPKRLSVGDAVALTLNESGETPDLVALHLEAQPDLSLTLVRAGDGGFRAASVNGRP